MLTVVWKDIKFVDWQEEDDCLTSPRGVRGGERMGVDDTSTADPVDESTTGMFIITQLLMFPFFVHDLEPRALALGSAKGFLSSSECDIKRGKLIWV